MFIVIFGRTVAKVCAQIGIYYGTRMSFSFVDTDDDSGDGKYVPDTPKTQHGNLMCSTTLKANKILL